MKTRRAILATGVALALTHGASAGMSTAPWGDARQGLSGGRETQSVVDASSQDKFTGSVGSDWGQADVSPFAAIAATPYTETPQADIRQLPPAPDSSSLFLCAMGSLGAWHLTRSFRKLSFSEIPDWFSPFGPGQIGHTVVVDLDASGLPACYLDRPAEVRPDFKFAHHQVIPSRGSPQHVPVVMAPRGPPCVNC